MNIIAVNDVIEINGLKWRIIQHRKAKFTLCQIDTSHLVCIVLDSEKLEFCIKQGIYKRVDFISSNVHDFEKLSTANKSRIEKAYVVCRYIIDRLDDLEDLCYPITDKVNTAMVQYNITKATVFKWLRMYLQNGMNHNALIANYSKCGAKGKSRTFKSRPGRKGVSHVLLNEEIKKIFDSAIQEYFFKNCQMTKHQLYVDMLSEYFYVYSEADGKWDLAEARYLPTERQFLNYFKDNVTSIEVKLNQIGERNMKNNYRPLKSDSRHGLYGIGSRFEVD